MNLRVDMARRQFSREFKIAAIRLVTERGVAVGQAARDLDVAESVLRRWMRELTATPATGFSGNGQMRADLAEIAALKKRSPGSGRSVTSSRRRQLFFAREAT